MRTNYTVLAFHANLLEHDAMQQIYVMASLMKIGRDGYVWHRFEVFESMNEDVQNVEPRSRTIHPVYQFNDWHCDRAPFRNTENDEEVVVAGAPHMFGGLGDG